MTSLLYLSLPLKWLKSSLKNAQQTVEDRFEAIWQGLHHQIKPAEPAPDTVNLEELPAKQFPPKGVRRWLNIYDPRDPVACAGILGRIVGGRVFRGLAVGEDFLYIDPADAQRYQRAFDVTIRNDNCPPEVSDVDVRAHSDTGYGECAQLAQAVEDFWWRFNRP